MRSARAPGRASLEEAFVQLIGTGEGLDVRRAILTVFRKEFRENLRDRRTLITGADLRAAVRAAAVLGGPVADDPARRGRRTRQPLELAVAHAERAPNLVRICAARRHRRSGRSCDDAAARAAIREQRSTSSC